MAAHSKSLGPQTAKQILDGFGVNTYIGRNYTLPKLEAEWDAWRAKGTLQNFVEHLYQSEAAFWKNVGFNFDTALGEIRSRLASLRLI